MELEPSGAGRIFPLLYSYLVIRGPDGELVPDLAENWFYDAQSFTWTIHLRKDAVFHDGRPVTSHDVKYSLEKFVQKKRLNYHSLVKEIIPRSHGELLIRLTAGAPDLLKDNWAYDIVQRPEATAGAMGESPIGSGPYKYFARDGDRRVVLVADENYYGGRPAIDRIEFVYEPSKIKTWARLLRGETDIGYEIAPGSYEMMRQYADRFYFEEYNSFHYHLLLYNLTDPLFSDARVRRALSLAIDNQSIVDEVLKGFGQPAIGPMGAGSPYVSPRMAPLPYDPDASLALFHAAGWRWDPEKRYLLKDGMRFEFTILLPKASPTLLKVARCIKLYFNDVGVKANIVAMPNADYVSQYTNNNEYQSILVTLGGAYHVPDTALNQWLGNQSGRTRIGGFKNDDINQLIQRIFSEENPAIKKQLCFQFDEKFVSLQPGTFLYHQKGVDVMSRRIHYPFPFTLSNDGITRLRSARIIAAKK